MTEITQTSNDNDTGAPSPDEANLRKFVDLIREAKIEINTGFVPDENGDFTHQVLQISCGEYVSVSDPEPLQIPVRPVPASELPNVTIN